MGPRNQQTASRNRGANAVSSGYRARRSREVRELLVVKRFAHRRYRSYPNVLAVGLGAKFRRHSGNPDSAVKLEGVTCVQFFVTRKRRRMKPLHRLPGFVYGRFLNGRVDRRRKVPTDVIPVGTIHAAGCAAGSQLDSNVDHGLITLIFRNKAGPGNVFYLISCAHVTGDLGRSPPAYPELSSDCSSATPFARTIVNSTAASGEIAYDIALAEVQDGALPLEELRIRDETFSLDSFLPAQSLQQGLGVSAVLRNCSTRGGVDSLDATAEVSYGGETFLVHNLFGVNVAAQKGDSGGLVYRQTQAVGLVVAASPQGWLWFQLLQPAVSFLNDISPVTIGVFNPQPINE
jgi:hypothetical protein